MSVKLHPSTLEIYPEHFLFADRVPGATITNQVPKAGDVVVLPVPAFGNAGGSLSRLTGLIQSKLADNLRVFTFAPDGVPDLHGVQFEAMHTWPGFFKATKRQSTTPASSAVDTDPGSWPLPTGKWKPKCWIKLRHLREREPVLDKEGRIIGSKMRDLVPDALLDSPVVLPRQKKLVRISYRVNGDKGQLTSTTIQLNGWCPQLWIRPKDGKLFDDERKFLWRLCRQIGLKHPQQILRVERRDLTLRQAWDWLPWYVGVQAQLYYFDVKQNRVVGWPLKHANQKYLEWLVNDGVQTFTTENDNGLPILNYLFVATAKDGQVGLTGEQQEALAWMAIHRKDIHAGVVKTLAQRRNELRERILAYFKDLPEEGEPVVRLEYSDNRAPGLEKLTGFMTLEDEYPAWRGFSPCGYWEGNTFVSSGTSKPIPAGRKFGHGLPNFIITKDRAFDDIDPTPGRWELTTPDGWSSEEQWIRQLTGEEQAHNWTPYRTWYAEHDPEKQRRRMAEIESQVERLYRRLRRIENILERWEEAPCFHLPEVWRDRTRYPRYHAIYKRKKPSRGGLSPEKQRLEAIDLTHEIDSVMGEWTWHRPDPTDRRESASLKDWVDKALRPWYIRRADATDEVLEVEALAHKLRAVLAGYTNEVNLDWYRSLPSISKTYWRAVRRIMRMDRTIYRRRLKRKYAPVCKSVGHTARWVCCSLLGRDAVIDAWRESVYMAALQAPQLATRGPDDRRRFTERLTRRCNGYDPTITWREADERKPASTDTPGQAMAQQDLQPAVGGQAG